MIPLYRWADFNWIDHVQFNHFILSLNDGVRATHTRIKTLCEFELSRQLPMINEIKKVTTCWHYTQASNWAFLTISVLIVFRLTCVPCVNNLTIVQSKQLVHQVLYQDIWWGGSYFTSYLYLPHYFLVTFDRFYYIVMLSTKVTTE